jgi:hypothetical protein
MATVYRLLVIAREEGMIPWEWIVDPTRTIQRPPSWADPDDFVRTVSQSYRRDFWLHQPIRIEVWSEKSTVEGVLAPVLHQYGVGFLPLHGYDSATKVHDASADVDRGGRLLIVFYVGASDPSGMDMSQRDLPKRLAKYARLEGHEGTHIELRRLALRREQVTGLIPFPASDKRKDPRHPWFVRNYGNTCWELDAMDPRDLRRIVEQAIRAETDWDAWNRCAGVEQAEQESLRHVLDAWGTGGGPSEQIRTGSKIIPPSQGGLWFHDIDSNLGFVRK